MVESQELGARIEKVRVLDNLYSPLQVKDLPRKILFETKKLNITPGKKNANLDDVIMRRQEGTTGRYIQI